MVFKLISTAEEILGWAARREQASPAPCGAGDARNLGQVVAEGGKYHRLGGTWAAAALRYLRRPGVLNQVGELRSPLNAAFGARVNAIPESNRAFDQVAGVDVAVAKSAGKKSVCGYRKLAARARYRDRLRVATSGSSQEANRNRGRWLRLRSCGRHTRHPRWCKHPASCRDTQACLKPDSCGWERARHRREPAHPAARRYRNAPRLLRQGSVRQHPSAYQTGRHGY